MLCFCCLRRTWISICSFVADIPDDIILCTNGTQDQDWDQWKYSDNINSINVLYNKTYSYTYERFAKWIATSVWILYKRSLKLEKLSERRRNFHKKSTLIATLLKYFIVLFGKILIVFTLNRWRGTRNMRALATSTDVQFTDGVRKDYVG